MWATTILKGSRAYAVSWSRNSWRYSVGLAPAQLTEDLRKMLLALEATGHGYIHYSPIDGAATSSLHALASERRRNWCGVSPVDLRNIRAK